MHGALLSPGSVRFSRSASCGLIYSIQGEGRFPTRARLSFQNNYQIGFCSISSGDPAVYPHYRFKIFLFLSSCLIFVFSCCPFGHPSRQDYHQPRQLHPSSFVSPRSHYLQYNKLMPDKSPYLTEQKLLNVILKQSRQKLNGNIYTTIIIFHYFNCVQLNQSSKIINFGVTYIIHYTLQISVLYKFKFYIIGIILNKLTTKTSLQSTEQNEMMELETSGAVPLPRFGHTLTFLRPEAVVLFGGAKGNSQNYTMSNDTYIFNTTTSMWSKVMPKEQTPAGRAAHAAVAVNEDYMLIFGGATGVGQLAPSEVYVFDIASELWRQKTVLGVNPTRRYGHSLVYSKPYVIMFGGMDGSQILNETWLLYIGETSNFHWFSLDIKGSIPTARVYHSAALCNKGKAKGMMCIFGGRDQHSKALNDVWGLRKHRNGQWDWQRAPRSKTKPVGRFQHHAFFFEENMIVFGGRQSPKIDCFNSDESEWRVLGEGPGYRDAFFVFQDCLYRFGGFQLNLTQPTSKIQMFDILELLSNNHISKIMKELKNEENQMRQSSESSTSSEEIRIPTFTYIKHTQSPSDDEQIQLCNHFSLALKFIQVLLQPSIYIDGKDRVFPFTNEEIYRIIQQAQEIFALQPTLLRVNNKRPVKIFGDLHGQYADLMRFFDIFGSPFVDGLESDIIKYDYLFLGDYVDRGNQSLETMCLLLALKIVYPNNIHLLRGNHEDSNINSLFGFSQECFIRLAESPDHPGSIYQSFNQMFRYMPLAAIVHDTIFCVHGGLGISLRFISQIERLNRPLDLKFDGSSEQQLLHDILWSDPTESDNDYGIQRNDERDPQGKNGISKFGPDVVVQFLKLNKLQAVIRAHECVMEGIEKFANGQLITLFSATDYCGEYGNGGAMLVVQPNLEIQPKIIYPYYPTTNRLRWNQDIIRQRPPTPPKWSQRPNH